MIRKLTPLFKSFFVSFSCSVRKDLSPKATTSTSCFALFKLLSQSSFILERVWYIFFIPHSSSGDTFRRSARNPFNKITNPEAIKEQPILTQRNIEDFTKYISKGIIRYHHRKDDVEGFMQKYYLSVPLWHYQGKLNKGDTIVFELYTYKEGMTQRTFTY